MWDLPHCFVVPCQRTPRKILCFADFIQRISS